MELWSLMHFLMPQVFSSHAQFKVCLHVFVAIRSAYYEALLHIVMPMAGV